MELYFYLLVLKLMTLHEYRLFQPLLRDREAHSLERAQAAYPFDPHPEFKAGKTAILITHDLSEAISVADRVVVLSSYFNQVWEELQK